MGITVSDIEQKEFAFKGAGYDPYDVDSYLDQVCDEMIAMQDRIDALEAELKQAKAAAEAATQAVRPMPQEITRTVEKEPIFNTSETLESILTSAQRISDEAVANAKSKAAEIVKNAEDQASELLGNVQEEKSTIEKDIKSLKAAASEYKRRFLALLNEHRSILEAEDITGDESEEAEVSHMDEEIADDTAEAQAVHTASKSSRKRS